MKYELAPAGANRVQELRPEDRPRERLIKYGAAVCSNQELIAIQIGSGTRRASAIDMANELVKVHQTLGAIAGLSVQQLSKMHGMGPVRAVHLLSALELAKRLHDEGARHLDVASSSNAAFQVLRTKFTTPGKEQVIILLLDTKNRVVGSEIISTGTLDSSLVHPREVFKPAVECGAASIILGHSHPSGDPTPSPEDRQVTRRIKEAGELIGIPLLDHIVVGEGLAYTSFADAGLL